MENNNTLEIVQKIIELHVEYQNDAEFAKHVRSIVWNIIHEDNYQNLLHGEYIDETENDYFYKTIDDYHNIEKYVNENYLSKYKL